MFLSIWTCVFSICCSCTNSEIQIPFISSSSSSFINHDDVDVYVPNHTDIYVPFGANSEYELYRTFLKSFTKSNKNKTYFKLKANLVNHYIKPYLKDRCPNCNRLTNSLYNMEHYILAKQELCKHQCCLHCIHTNNYLCHQCDMVAGSKIGTKSCRDRIASVAIGFVFWSIRPVVLILIFQTFMWFMFSTSSYGDGESKYFEMAYMFPMFMTSFASMLMNFGVAGFVAFILPMFLQVHPFWWVFMFAVFHISFLIWYNNCFTLETGYFDATESYRHCKLEYGWEKCIKAEYMDGCLCKGPYHWRGFYKNYNDDGGNCVHGMRRERTNPHCRDYYINDFHTIPQCNNIFKTMQFCIICGVYILRIILHVLKKLFNLDMDLAYI